MELNSEIIIFLIGFFSGVLIVSFLYFIINSRKKIDQQKNHDLDSLKTNIESIIGPCINFKHYEVGRDLYLKYYKKNKKYKKFFIKKDSNKYLFNLSHSIEYQLKKLGIKRVIICNEDTYSNKRKYFSHRRSTMKGDSNTGRMINIIGFLRK